MSRFIGRDDYVDPVFIDPTWGVSDEDYRRDKAALSDETLAAELSAFIETAMQVLYDNRTGLPEISSALKEKKQTTD